MTSDIKGLSGDGARGQNLVHLASTDQKALIPGPRINLEVPMVCDPKVHAPYGLGGGGQNVKFYNKFKNIISNIPI